MFGISCQLSASVKEMEIVKLSVLVPCLPPATWVAVVESPNGAAQVPVPGEPPTLLSVTLVHVTVTADAGIAVQPENVELLA